MLSGEFGSSLTGRHLSVELYPFSLTEIRKLAPRTSLLDFLQHGGFPEAVKSKNSDALLRQYFADIVERDIRERVAARSSQPLRQLVQMVFESAGSELSVRRIAAAIGIAVETAQGYLQACESAYLLFECPFFAYSLRKSSTRNKKYYPVDTGLRRVAVSKTGDDHGKLLECATYLALRQRYPRVCYWRGRGEIDFVVENATGETVPIQVTWNNPEARHKIALDEFYGEFPRAREAVLVTRHTFAELEKQGWPC